MQATVGADAADLALKAAAKRRLDAVLQPLRLLARAWSGAVMLAAREMDDEWLALARAVAATGEWPQVLTDRQTAMLAAGSQALPWDLTFPEVFWPDGADVDQGGFDAVLSNPPWDIMQPNTAEFLARFDLAILGCGEQAGGTCNSRSAADRSCGGECLAGLSGGVRAPEPAGGEALPASAIRCPWHGHGRKARSVSCVCRANGSISSIARARSAWWFHRRSTPMRVRRASASSICSRHGIEQCLSFENRKNLFDIHARFKFALVVARRPGPTQTVRCRFYLTEFAQIDEPARAMDYDMEFIAISGGAYATLLELRDRDDVAVARRMLVGHQRFGEWMEAAGISLSREMHMTDDAGRFRAISHIQRIAIRQ